MIVVGEDDEDIRELVTYKLQQVGHTVVAAADGAVVLDIVRQSRPDLVILDVMMPEVSGFEVCRGLRGDPATVDLPVILLTARAQEHDIETGFSVGAHDYMVKPFSVRELVSRVESVLSRAAA
jgi:DNA-binding response OmpR family regulator